MKKLVAGAAVAALLGSAAFAEVSVGAWGRAVAGIGNATNSDNDGTDTIISNTQSWGGNGPRFGITFSGDYEGTVGFSAQAFLNGSEGWAVGDAATVWYAPIEQLKVWLGRDNCGNPLRGDACYGTWDLYRVGTMKGDYHEGWTFQGQGCTGAAIGVFPIEGLSFYASLNYPYREYSAGVDSNGSAYKSGSNEQSASALFGNVLGRNWSKYSLAYDIEGVGTIKAGVECQGLVSTWDKNGKTEQTNQNVINVAFDLKAMEDVFYLSVGAFIPTVQGAYSSKVLNDEISDESDVTYAYGSNRVNAYARITPMEGLNIHAQFGTKINTYNKNKYSNDENIYEDGLGFLVAGGVDYKLADDLKIYADVGYANGLYWSSSDADNTDCLNFGFGVQKDYGPCNVAAGFVGATNGNGMYTTTYKDGTDTKYPFSWGIPLAITYSF